MPKELPTVGGDVAAVIVNFQTPDLTQRAVESLRRWYPGLHLILIDNGSMDESVSFLKSLQKGSPSTIELVLNNSNLHHGPAMDQGIRRASSAYVLLMDSDCEVTQGGFLDDMLLELSRSEMNYAIGKRIAMNKRGFDVAVSAADSVPYIRPICMLLRRELYLQLPPFELHGAPCLKNMTVASRKGLELLDFPILQFVSHKGRGTAAKHGYRLGLKGKLNHLLNKLGL